MFIRYSVALAALIASTAVDVEAQFQRRLPAPQRIGPFEQFADSLLGITPRADRLRVKGEDRTLKEALKAAEVDPGIIILPPENVDQGLVITPPDSVDAKMILPGKSWDLRSRRQPKRGR